MLRLIAIFIGLFMQTITSPAQNNIATFNLENGLQIVVIPDHRAKVVTHMIWYKVGAVDELPKQSGLAHFLEHLMFKGTEEVAAGEFSKFVAEVGGTENAFTSDDYTAYFQRVPPSLLQKVMELESDRMKNLTLNSDDIETERLVVLEERNLRTDSKPSALFVEKMNSALYQNHPYGIPIIGWRDEIEKLTKEQILQFYEKHYTPNNAVLVVAGDIEANTVLELAKQTYGKIAANNADDTANNRQKHKLNVLGTRERIDMADERVKTPLWQRYYLVPSYQTSQNNNDGEALDILSEILGGGATSRLYTKLVVEEKIATYAGSAYRGERLLETIFVFAATPTPDSSLQKIESLIDGEIKKLLANGIEKHELERAQQRLVRAAIFAQDSQEILARLYGTALALGNTTRDVQEWSKNIKAVTVADVERVAKTYLISQRSVTGTLTSAK